MSSVLMRALLPTPIHLYVRMHTGLRLGVPRRRSAGGMLVVRRLERNPDREQAALARTRLDFQLAAMRRHDMLADGQTQTHAALLPDTRILSAEEALPQP